MDIKRVDAAVSAYGSATRSKLSNVAAQGSPEDQLRGPMETLVRDLAHAIGMDRDSVVLVGETALGDLKTRPDFSVTVANALNGFIELKAPGKGADPTRFTDPHDKVQWEKLKALPNLLYSDGMEFGLWRDGNLEGDIVRLDGDIRTAGSALGATGGLVALIASFLAWKPVPPRSVSQLAGVSARLCRLLRDEVAEQVAAGSPALTGLAEDWRKILFPDADDAKFADGYAQAVTFGLLVARARGISLAAGIEAASSELRATNSLIGTALHLLTDNASSQEALKTSLDTMVRVIASVDWKRISKDNPDKWLYFYEDFLEVYDNDLRRRTGSYYTPPDVVTTMVRLVDELLVDKTRFNQELGLASPEVTIADPAVGTGTFLLGILRRIEHTTGIRQGKGSVAGALVQAVDRLIGFEIQFGPFAVAQLRMTAELAEKAKDAKALPLQLFLTDTLGNPFQEEEWLPQMFQPLAESRRQANQIKAREPVTVCIGNPPYKDRANGLGGWIESGSPTMQAPMNRWMPPPAWKVGRYARHMKNLYVYFWRWATWKVFGDAADGKQKNGIVCFITASAYLNSPGFQKVREDLRRTASDIWVVDCSPDGHRPEVQTRIFQDVQPRVCIMLVCRTAGTCSETPANVRYQALPVGHRTLKFAALKALKALKLEGEDAGWLPCPNDWRSPFLPESNAIWSDFPALTDLFTYGGTGVMTGRSWVIAPDAGSLRDRWAALVAEGDATRKEALFQPHSRKGKPGDRHSRKIVTKGLSGHAHRPARVSDDVQPVVTPSPYAFRSFDRQWIIPDSRLINQANPSLWDGYSVRQVFLTAPEDKAPSSGTPVSFTDLIPDAHHYNGRGGRVYPLWKDAAGQNSNTPPALLEHLGGSLGRTVSAEDLMAYVAGVTAHPAFTERFGAEFVRPGMRLPLTKDVDLFSRAVELGREVIWLHTFGNRYVDPSEQRPHEKPRMPDTAPTIPEGGGIPIGVGQMPNEIGYDAELGRLMIGAGFIDNVPAAVWNYEVSGHAVVKEWFTERKKDRTKPIIGNRTPPSALTKIHADRWIASYNTDLLDLLNVVGRLIALEPRQEDLLDAICAGPLVSLASLRSAGACVDPSASDSRPVAADPDQPKML